MTQRRRSAVAAATPSRPPRRGRSRCVPWLGATTAALGGCAYACCWPSPTTASHPLQPILRVRERDLDVPTFVDTYVRPRVPVIVELEAPERTERTVLAALRGACAREPITLLSAIMAEFVDAARASYGLALALALARRAAGGSGGAAALVAEAELTMGELFARIDAAPFPPPAPPFAPAVRRLRALGFTQLAGVIRLFGLGLSSSRLYLTDTPPRQALPGCMAEVLAAFVRDGASEHWVSPFDASIFRAKITTRMPHVRLFLGAPGTASYPLHGDVGPGDLFFRVLAGAKRVALFEATDAAAAALTPLWMLPHPANHSFAHDPFAAAPPADVSVDGAAAPVAGGWAATIGPGEVLYAPERFLHQVENVGRSGTLGLINKWPLELDRETVRQISR